LFITPISSQDDGFEFDVEAFASHDPKVPREPPPPAPGLSLRLTCVFGNRFHPYELIV
jgi:hypothetical protein